MSFVHHDSLLTVTINGLGLYFELAYLGTFLLFVDIKGQVSCFFFCSFSFFFVQMCLENGWKNSKICSYLRRKWVFVSWLKSYSWSFVILITFLFLHGTMNRSFMVGSICYIMGYVSPLTIIVSKIRSTSWSNLHLLVEILNIEIKIKILNSILQYQHKECIGMYTLQF